MLVLNTMEREYPYGTLRSTNGSKSKIALEEKRLDYTVNLVRPGDVWKKVPEVLAKHPLGKVPWLDDGDQTVFDSTVINEYLNDAYPDPPLLPDSAINRARARGLENLGDEGILSKHLPLIWMPWWAPADKRDQATMEQGRQGLRKEAFPIIEREIEGREYLCDKFSLADIPYMVVAMVLQVDGMDLEEFPNTEGYFSRLRARSSYTSIDPNTPIKR